MFEVTYRDTKALPETWDLLFGFVWEGLRPAQVRANAEASLELISYYLLYVYSTYKGSNKSFISVCTAARNQFYFCNVSKILMLKMRLI